MGIRIAPPLGPRRMEGASSGGSSTAGPPMAQEPGLEEDATPYELAIAAATLGGSLGPGLAKNIAKGVQVRAARGGLAREELRRAATEAGAKRSAAAVPRRPAGRPIPEGEYDMAPRTWQSGEPTHMRDRDVIESLKEHAAGQRRVGDQYPMQQQARDFMKPPGSSGPQRNGPLRIPRDRFEELMEYHNINDPVSSLGRLKQLRKAGKLTTEQYNKLAMDLYKRRMSVEAPKSWDNPY